MNLSIAVPINSPCPTQPANTVDWAKLPSIDRTNFRTGFSWSSRGQGETRINQTGSSRSFGLAETKAQKPQRWCGKLEPSPSELNLSTSDHEKVWNSGPVALTCILKTYFQDIYYLIKLYIYITYIIVCCEWITGGFKPERWKLLETPLPGLPFWTIRASTSFRLVLLPIIDSFIRSCLHIWPFETDSYLMHHHNNETPRILESCKTTMFASASLSQSMVWIRSNTSNCVP